MSKRTRDSDIISGYSVKKWHPWVDRPGMPRTPAVWEYPTITTLAGGNGLHCDSVESMRSTIAHNRLFTLCTDILSIEDIPFANDLLGASRVTPYLTRGGTIPAMLLQEKRNAGFLIPASTWKWREVPNQRLLENLVVVFTVFGYQASTPSSLSEKVLRSTLETPLNISRPSVMLRQDILQHSDGPRIDLAPHGGRVFRYSRQYDKNKAYLYHSQRVPDPFHAPTMRRFPTLDELFTEYATGWWECDILPCDTPIAPIHIKGSNPIPGTWYHVWLWSGEIADCIAAGYEVRCTGGYGFKAMSTFMEKWVDILYAAYEKSLQDDPHITAIIKGMMVGLPGRFLCAPETYLLIPLEEWQVGDIPLVFTNFSEKSQHFSDWLVRPVYEKESTHLSHVGAYIVAEMRRELYARMKGEYEHGNTVVKSYVDSYTISGDTAFPESIGPALGQYKEARTGAGYFEQNRGVIQSSAGDEWETIAPGFSRERRIAFTHMARKKIREHLENTSN